MRKGFLVSLALFLIFPVFSESLPQTLNGIWEGKDRFVFFEQFPADENPELVLLLKEYYGWYIDRVVEPEKYAEKVPRVRNSATTKNSEKVSISTEEGINEEDTWEGNIILTYSKSQKNYIPVCSINDNIYLNYYIQDKENPNFFKGGIVSQGIKANEQIIPENITCFIIDDDKIYNVCYWKTDMDFSSDLVTFKYKNDNYEIPKHIKTGNVVYSCVNGKSKRVRNTQPPQNFIKENYIWNKKGDILVLDKEPYLHKLVDSKTFEDLMKIVVTANSRRKPEPPPLFPPDDLNWHWDLIDMLEKDNVLIQQVRERQKKFGPRPKDL